MPLGDGELDPALHEAESFQHASGVVAAMHEEARLEKQAATDGTLHHFLSMSQATREAVEESSAAITEELVAKSIAIQKQADAWKKMASQAGDDAGSGSDGGDPILQELVPYN